MSTGDIEIFWRDWWDRYGRTKGARMATYVHLHREDAPGEVSTVAVYNDGYVDFLDQDIEYSIQDLRDVLAAAELELDNQTEDRLDWWDDEDWQDLADVVDEDVDELW